MTAIAQHKQLALCTGLTLSSTERRRRADLVTESWGATSSSHIIQPQQNRHRPCGTVMAHSQHTSITMMHGSNLGPTQAQSQQTQLTCTHHYTSTACQAGTVSTDLYQPLELRPCTATSNHYHDPN
jgi:hypothetical protein